MKRGKLKKNLKRKIIPAIIGTLWVSSLGGCAGAPKQAKGETAEGTEISGVSDTGEKAKGRYMEYQKATPEGLKQLDSLVRLSDGSLSAADALTGTVYVSKDDGGSWEQKEAAPLTSVVDEGTEITSLALAPDGGIFFSYIDWSANAGAADGGAEEEDEAGAAGVEDGKISEHYVYVDAGGQERTVPVSQDQGEYYVEQAVFGDNGELYLRFISGKIYQVDLATGDMKKITEVSHSGFGLFAKGDYLVSVGVEQAEFYQFSAGKQLEPDTVLNEFIHQEAAGSYALGLFLDEEEGKVYTASASGLYSHVLSGSVMDQLLDGGLSSLSDPSKSVASLIKNEDGSFLLGYKDGEIDSLVYDKDASAVPEQQLSVYTLQQNDTISKAVSTFRKKHPEVFIKQEIGLTGEADITAEDAVRNLNTSMLSGEGPDIILLDGMPEDSYVEKGMLADLTDFVEKMQKDNSFFNNILLTYQKQDGIYALPTRFRIPIMLAEKQTLGGIDSLEKLGDAVTAEREKKPDQKTILGTYAPDELLAALREVNAPAWVKDGEFQKDAVLEFLTQAQRIYQAEHQNITPEQEQLHQQTIEQSSNYGSYGITGVNTYAEYMTLMSASQVFDILGGEASIATGKLNGMQSYEMLTGLLKTKNTCDFMPMAGQAEKVFCPVGIVGVSARTKEETLCYEFMTELFGTDVLKNDLGDGFPVSRSAFKEFSKNPNRDDYEVGFSVSSEDGLRVEFTATWPTKEEISGLEELIESLTTPSSIESMLKDAVMEVGEKVLTGEKTPEEGADEIGQKMELYFAE